MMQIQKHHALQILTLCAALTLSACGGGSSSSATTNNGTGNADTPSSSGASGGTSGTSSGGATTSGSTSSDGGGTPTPTLTADECPFGDYKSAMVAAVNNARASAQICGGVLYPAVGPLRWDSQLEAAATRHSNDMAVNNIWGHVGSDGSTIRDRAPAAGYNYSAVGENLAGGQTSANAAVSGFLASPSHCANLMNASYVDIGTSCKYNPNSAYWYYWTLVMGTR